MNRKIKRSLSLRESWGTRSSITALALRRFAALFAATFLALVGMVGMERVANAAAAVVTTSNAKLEGSAPVMVGNSLNYSVDIAFSGNRGDTFTIQLPPELDYAGPLSFSLNHAQCTWAGKTATCTLTETVKDAVGGMSFWVKAVGETSSSSSTIIVGGQPLRLRYPAGRLDQVAPLAAAAAQITSRYQTLQ